MAYSLYYFAGYVFVEHFISALTTKTFDPVDYYHETFTYIEEIKKLIALC